MLSAFKGYEGKLTGYGDSVCDGGGGRSGNREDSLRRQEERSVTAEQATSAKALRWENAWCAGGK